MKVCPVCKTKYEGDVCPGCGTAADGFFDPSEVTLSSSEAPRGESPSGAYVGANLAIPALFLVFAVLFVVACAAMPLANDSYAFPSGTTIINNSHVEGLSDNFLTVFCFVTLGVAAVFLVIAYLLGGRKAERASLYRMAGIAGAVCTLIALASGIWLCVNLWNTPFENVNWTPGSSLPYASSATSPGAGPVCVLCSGAAFFVAFVVMTCVSALYEKRHPDVVRPRKNRA